VVINSLITFESVSAFVAILVAIAGAWWRIENRLNRVADAAAAERKMIWQRLAALEKDHHDHKLDTAKTYMSKASGGAAIDRMATEMRLWRDEIRGDIKELARSIRTSSH